MSGFGRSPLHTSSSYQHWRGTRQSRRIGQSPATFLPVSTLREPNLINITPSSMKHRFITQLLSFILEYNGRS
ncbi:hypothetical protein FOXYSP1_16849 [Fusarium oxysporum f. sp. phaseoli]